MKLTRPGRIRIGDNATDIAFIEANAVPDRARDIAAGVVVGNVKTIGYKGRISQPGGAQQ